MLHASCGLNAAQCYPQITRCHRVAERRAVGRINRNSSGRTPATFKDALLVVDFTCRRKKGGCSTDAYTMPAHASIHAINGLPVTSASRSCSRPFAHIPPGHFGLSFSLILLGDRQFRRSGSELAVNPLCGSSSGGQTTCKSVSQSPRGKPPLTDRRLNKQEIAPLLPPRGPLRRKTRVSSVIHSVFWSPIGVAKRLIDMSTLSNPNPAQRRQRAAGWCGSSAHSPSDWPLSTPVPSGRFRGTDGMQGLPLGVRFVSCGSLPDRDSLG